MVNQQSNPIIPKDGDTLIETELKEMHKLFMTSLEQINKYVVQHVPDEELLPHVVSYSYCDLIFLLATHLELAIQISMKFGYSRNVIENTIKDANNRVSINFQKVVDLTDLQREINHAREYGNNRLADMLSDELASYDRAKDSETQT